MKIAVVGGGASGMVTAYLLNKKGYDITVFEKQSILGGHIRTINKNIHVEQLSQGYFLECGVLEFPSVFYNFLALMKELKVELKPIKVGSGLFLKNGNYFLSPLDIKNNFTGLQRTIEFLKLDALYLQTLGLQIKIYLSKLQDLYNQPMSKFLKSKHLGDSWMELLTMYSYSMPFELIDDFPAELAIPTLRDYVLTNWFRIEGGVYSYIEKILEFFTGKVLLNAQIREIARENNGVTVRLKNGFIYTFDKIIFATPPDQVLELLVDPTPQELRCFSEWQKNEVITIVHTDTVMYERYNIQQFSEFDFIETNNGWGYNAYLNQLCGVSSSVQYSLAFNLGSVIAEDKILYSQKHHTPLYTVGALRYRQEIIKNNGEHNTYHVGAYLGDGLHEGAITSAKHVAELIG